MYRLLVLIVAVVLLGAAAFWGGFLFSNKPAQKRTDNIAAIIADTEKSVPAGTEQGVTEGDGSSVLNLDALKLDKPLTAEDVQNVVQQAGLDAEQTALRVGHNAEQAALARKTAEDVVRVHMERRMRDEQAGNKAL
ncbi:hypothetical protein KQ944_12050 [Bacillus subtilis]|uniref:hypothetical protein n=1 Tax=Pseudochrobactrum asaccharolyticum TaxID=354351 RepID=UPI001F27A2DD|nr:hypothetical protein [Pseudochrobactrum asaccharolyticum]MCF7645899.1 hypothetical protein [Pseudochrobactrum asaccharolyticum]MCF7672364.1 hypothetical protein [Bacillus subtilis]